MWSAIGWMLVPWQPLRTNHKYEDQSCFYLLIVVIFFNAFTIRITLT